MNIIELWQRVRFLARRDRFDRELEEEIRFHIEMRIEENLAEGMPEDQARFDALRRFGNSTILREQSREVWTFRNLEVFMQDLRYAVRTLFKKPAFALVAIAALALGIGANTAIFSAVNAVLLRPLPFENPDRIVNLFGASVSEPNLSGMLSYPDYLDLKARSNSIEYAGSSFVAGTVLKEGDEPERITGASVSADIFPLLGAQPLLGRAFNHEEDKPGEPSVIILSYEYWMSRFGGDRGIIGRTIKIGKGKTVIGVMPPEFSFPLDSPHPVQFWLPISYALEPEYVERRDVVWFPALARLKPGVTLRQAQAELETLAYSLEQEYPATNTNRRFRLEPLHESLVRDIRPALLVLLGAVGFVLLIACANVANLLLARATTRSKEIAIRAAMGASRGRIVRQLLVESLILALMGGVAGLLLALWGVELLVKLSPADVPRINEVGLDLNVLAFTFLVSVLTGVLFGLTPALGASKVDLNEVMKEGGRGSTERKGRKSMRSALVIAEVALSLVLVIGTGLLIKSFMRLMWTDPGYDTEHVFTMTLPLSTQKYAKPEQQAAFFEELIRLIREVPGVEAAGATNLLPLSGRDIIFDFNIEGRPAAPVGEELTARYNVMSPAYFETMKMPLLRGRALTGRDGPNAPQVMIVNEAFARYHFPDEDALGRRVIPNDPEDPPREIVGIVGDVRQRGLEEDVLPIVYVSHLQDPRSQMELVVRTASETPADLAPAVRNVIRQANKDQLIWQTRTMSQLLSRSVAPRRFNVILLATFTAVALVLSVIGIFGVMNYSVIQRTHEIGIRMALGAQRGDVLRMVIGQGMALVLVGLGVGLAGALALTRVLSSLLYGVSATDPVVFAAVAILFAAVSLIACYLPARRAMRIDPLAAIRYE